MRQVLRDVRFAYRALDRDRRVTATAVLTVGLALGANTTLYSVVRAVLIDELPYRAADELALIWRPADRGETTWLSLREVIAYREAARTLSRVDGYARADANFTEGAEPERVQAAQVTVGLFDTLGVPAAVGRTFIDADEAPGAEPAILLGHALWHRRFGADAAVVGTRVRVNGVPRTVVGVLPPEFRLPLDFAADRPTEAWLPVTVTPGNPGNWGDRSFVTVARLAAGATPAQASGELHAIADGWVEAGYLRDQGPGAWHRDALPIQPFVTREVRTPLLVLLGAVVAVLLVAASNVANLLVARADLRRRELAVRVALGAARAAVVRQLIAEGILLSVAGGALGIVLALAARGALASVSPATLPRIATVELDGWVLALSASVAVVTGVACGLAPAWRLSRTGVAAALNEAGRAGTPTGGRHAFRRALVVAQLAGSVILLIGAALLARSLLAMSRVDLGFDSRHVLTAQVQLPPADYADNDAVVRFFRELTADLEALPDVEHAGAVRILPLSRTIGDWSITIEGRPAGPTENPNADFQAVTPGYFEAMRVPLVRGRFIGPGDREGAPIVAVINEVMAARYWPGQDPLGSRFHMGTSARPWVTIVGVVRTVRHNAVLEEPRAEMYLPHAQLPGETGSTPRAMVLAVRTAGDPLAALAGLKATVRAMDARLPVSDILPMDDVVSRALAGPRFTARVLGLLALVGLVIAAIGTYATVVLIVSDRRREFSIRLALGAAPGGLQRLVLGQACRLAAGGALLGLGGAALLVRLLESLMYGVEPLDPVTFVSVPLGLGGIVLVAALGPALRASRSDPAAVLRA